MVVASVAVDVSATSAIEASVFTTVEVTASSTIDVSVFTAVVVAASSAFNISTRTVFDSALAASTYSSLFVTADVA